MLKNLFRHSPAEDPAKNPDDLEEAVDLGTSAAISSWLGETSNLNRGSQLDDLDHERAAKLAGLLTPDTAEELLESVSPHTALHFLRRVPEPAVGGLLDALDSDVATRIVELMDEDEAQQALHFMAVSRSTIVRGLLAWPDESAASRMRAEYIHVGPDATMADAVAAAREEPEDVEDGVFVTEKEQGEHKLLGWLSPAVLLASSPESVVTEVMMPYEHLKQWAIKPLADQEAVAQRVRAYNSQIVPIVEDDVLLGVISLDQARDITHEEATEDAELQGGSAPLEVPYLKASPGRLWRKRVGWLLVLFIAEMYTGTVLRAFEGELEAVVALSFFIPLLIGTGGNVRLRDLARVIGKELLTGSLLAATMGVAGAIRAWTLGVGPQVILVVAIALACIVIWASFVAAILPLILKSLHVDPAVVSGPMISTVVDGTGLMIYFYIAKLVMGL